MEADSITLCTLATVWSIGVCTELIRNPSLHHIDIYWPSCPFGVLWDNFVVVPLVSSPFLLLSSDQVSELCFFTVLLCSTDLTIGKC